MSAVVPIPPASLASLTPRPDPTGSAPGPFAVPAASERVERAAERLRANGFEVVFAADRDAARAAVLERIPAGSEVLDVSSQTLVALGLPETLHDPARFDSVRPRLAQLAESGRVREQRKLGAAPDFVVGSVHAITEDGQAVIASGSGSQLAPYAFGAGRVLWVVGTQKIVPDLATAVRRLNEHTFPLEDARAKAAYGRGSAIAKLLVINLERPGRITVVLVPENLGF